MTELVVLGAGTPTPTPSRWGSAFAARVGGEHIMFDCGPAATWKLVKAGIVPTQVDYLFFTHHHFDHDVDYPCFLLTRWDQSVGRENLLRVYGPTLTETLTECIDQCHDLLTVAQRVLVGLPDLQQLRNTAEAVCVSSLLQADIKCIGNRDGLAHSDAPYLGVLCATIILDPCLWV